MIDVAKLADALCGDDGEVRVLTEWEDCHVVVIGGKPVHVVNALRKVITREDIDLVLASQERDIP